jgi:virulence-associated protein VagC
MKPEKIKELLQQKGLIQNDLFAWGTSKPSGAAVGLGAAFGALGGLLASSTIKTVGITLIDGKLVITPVTKKEAMAEDAVRLSKDDINEITFKTKLGAATLMIVNKEGKKNAYNIGKPFDAMKMIVDKFNGGSPDSGL